MSIIAGRSRVGAGVCGTFVNRLGRPLVVWGLGITATAGGLVLTVLLTPPQWTPWAVAGVLTVGGFAGGLVTAPNQTLMLADIPVSEGGVAGSVGQLGQRIGTAMGTAVGLAMFYAIIYRDQGGTDTVTMYRDAYSHAMIAVGIFLSLAVIAAVTDLGQRHRAAAKPGAA